MDLVWRAIQHANCSPGGGGKLTDTAERDEDTASFLTTG